MPRIRYEDKRLSPAKRRTIDQANEIIAEYEADGLDLTLRQLYYQFVSRDLIPNRQTEYKRLGEIVADGRLCGLIDWDAITDRTRNLRKRPEWARPEDLAASCAAQYRIDRWKGQAHRPEVWIEKDALVGLLEGVCIRNGVAFFSCRGYTSLSEVWAAAQRLVARILEGQTPVIIHLGDHDPSGIDMTRDIYQRLAHFVVCDLVKGGRDLKEFLPKHGGRIPFVVERIALNMDQVRHYKPPPNPAKQTDSRFADYAKKHGTQSWELDALDPKTIVSLIDSAIAKLRTRDAWKRSGEAEEQGRSFFEAVSSRFADVAEFLSQDRPMPEFIIQVEYTDDVGKHRTKYARLNERREVHLVLTPTQASRYASEAAALADVARYYPGNFATCTVLPARARRPPPAPARKLAGADGPLFPHA